MSEAENTLEYSLKGISELHFALLPDTLPPFEQMNPNGLSISTELNLEFREEDDDILVILGFMYMYDHGEGDGPQMCLKSKTVTVFNVKDLSQFRTNRDSIEEFPEGFIEMIVGIAISTARGIIATRVGGTIFQRYPLPLMFPSELISGLTQKGE